MARYARVNQGGSIFLYHWKIRFSQIYHSDPDLVRWSSLICCWIQMIVLHQLSFYIDLWSLGPGKSQIFTSFHKRVCMWKIINKLGWLWININLTSYSGYGVWVMILWILMYDLQSYLGKMSAGMVSNQKLTKLSLVNLKRKRKIKVHHKQTFINNIISIGKLLKTIFLKLI